MKLTAAILSLMSISCAYSQELNHSKKEEPCVQGMPLTQGCSMDGSYNAPGAIDLKGTDINIFVEGAFTYWYPHESCLNIAQSAILTNAGTTVNSPNSESVSQSSGYVPGFEVALGAVLSSQWSIEGKYIWFRSNQDTSQSAPTNTSSITGTGVWNMDDWFLQSTSISNQSLTGTSFSSTWKLSMDLGDLTCSKPFYVAKNLIFSPLLGARTVWFRQNLSVDLYQAAASVGGSGNLDSQPINSTTSSNSWGIGPRMGFGASYLMAYGLRLDATVASSLLFTHFSSINHQEDRYSLLVTSSEVFRNTTGDINCVRPNIELGGGFSWGTYFSEQKYYLELSAYFDFYYFWDQNVMRQMLDQYWTGAGSTPGDLSLQGLTIQARFDF